MKPWYSIFLALLVQLPVIILVCCDLYWWAIIIYPFCLAGAFYIACLDTK